MSALPKRCFTPEEYLEMELKAEYKSQYVAGEIYAMAGAQPWHVRVTDNLIVMLNNRLRGRTCESFSSDMRVRVEEADIYTYPDVSALCGVPQFETDANPQSLLNPQVIFEVLSPSTEAFDRGDKFMRYRKLRSLKEYVLVASEQMQVEYFVRQPNGAWIMTDYSAPEHVIPLSSLGCELPLSEIYDRVAFPGSEEMAR